MKIVQLLLSGSWLVLACGALGCGRGDEGIPSAATSLPVATAAVEASPKGRWRLASYEELDQSMIWASQILIRHVESEEHTVPFSVWPWQVDVPAATRTREEALSLALEVARLARATPDRFAELAARYSDDVTSKEHGGRLGGLPLSHYMSRPSVLDALAATAPRAVSAVVETALGFHIFSREPPPSSSLVTGERIVIGYAGAGWLPALGAETPSRMRGEARRLAWQIYERARAQPEQFAALVQEHSEHPDRARGGDFGTWSVDERTVFARELELLRRLRVGEVGEPLDSPAGFEIIRRVHERPRKQYAMQAVMFPFDRSAPEPDPASEASVHARALGVARELVADPSAFADALREHCCDKPRQWLEGRDETMLSAALDRLEPGQISPEPVREFNVYAIPMRIEPFPAPTPEARFDVPTPAHVDMTDVIRRTANSGTFAEEAILDAIAAAPESLGLAPVRASLDVMVSHLSTTDDPEQRLALYRDFSRDVRTLLGPDRAARLEQLIVEHFDRYYMSF